MMSGEPGRSLILWTARIAVTCYLIAVWMHRNPTDRSQIDGRVQGRTFAWFWFAAWLLLVIHVIFSYHFEHHWSQAAALRHTAEMTERVVGWHWGGGLYINYVFLVIALVISRKFRRQGKDPVMLRHFSVVLMALLFCNDLCAQQKQTREQKVREDRDRVVREGFWIYNDLPAAFAAAKAENKPLLVVLRCLPCEECVKLDDELVDRDPVIRPLLEKFVCVRVVSTNGLDLSLFQFDTDQSFAAFMLNADRTIYGRFGTRSHRTEWIGDVSLPGLAAALTGALELHANYPRNRESLAGKTGPQPLFTRPEMFPSLKDRYTDSLNYSGDVVRSCIHCHQIGDAVRDHYRHLGQPIPETELFPYPHPKSVGLVLDPATPATVKTVVLNSDAYQSGFRVSDQIRILNGQPILSLADVQWVLHSVAPEGGTVEAVVDRAGRREMLQLKLPAGWRRAGDISWRASTWGLRRMTTGGLQLEPADDSIRQDLGLSSDAMALRVRHVGQYGAHAAAKMAGFQVDDVLVEIDDKRDIMTETDLIRYGMTEKRAGERMLVTVVRNGSLEKLSLPMQK